MNKDLLLHQLALTMVPGIGDVQGKKLVSYCQGVEAIFREKKSKLLRIEGIGKQLVNELSNKQIFSRAEEEMRFIEKYNIKPLFYYDKDYPTRLKHCADSPLMLFYKGTADLNKPKVLAVVGTRKPTSYGKSITAGIIEDLRQLDLLVVSGLAYGVDSCAHKAAIENNLETIGVLAHGLDLIYPELNRGLAEKMIIQGGLLTEFISGTKLNRDFFPRRNRIVAGMSDAVLVIESAGKGGALITADIAQSYNRDVLAIPGRAGEKMSEGCNSLIKMNKAALVESAQDIIMTMRWDDQDSKVSPQKKLFLNLSDDEQLIIDAFGEHSEMGIDEIYLKTGLSLSKVSSLLLNLEFEGVIKALPGKVFRRL